MKEYDEPSLLSLSSIMQQPENIEEFVSNSAEIAEMTSVDDYKLSEVSENAQSCSVHLNFSDPGGVRGISKTKGTYRLPSEDRFCLLRYTIKWLVIFVGGSGKIQAACFPIQ